MRASMGWANPALAMALEKLQEALADPLVDVAASMRGGQRGCMSLVFDVRPASDRRVRRSARSYARLQSRWDERTAAGLNRDAQPFVPEELARGRTAPSGAKPKAQRSENP